MASVKSVLSARPDDEWNVINHYKIKTDIIRYYYCQTVGSHRT